MKFTVTLADATTHEVEAHTFDPQPGIVTFLNDTRTPVAAFSGWVAVQQKAD